MVGLSFVPGALVRTAPWPGLSLAPGELVLTARIGERCVKRRRLGQPAASESAAARSSAAGQPSAETVLGRAAVSGEPERHEPPQRSTGACGDAACIAH